MIARPRRPALLLELDLTEPPVQPDPDDPLARFRGRNRASLPDVLRALHEAGRDARVAGLVVRVGGRLPWALAQELRRGVEAFTAAGRPAIAWAETFSEAGDTPAYLLATGFDRIWLQPGGSLGLLGAGVEAAFAREALDRLGIEPEIEQRYEYKNAPDTLLRREMSAAQREALARVTASLTDQAVSAIAAGRRLPPDRVRELMAGGPYLATTARELGLVDDIGYRDQVYEAARAAAREHAGGRDISLLYADRWQPRRRWPRLRRHRAVVGYVELRGGIGAGRSRRGLLGRQAGSDTVGAALRAARTDRAVRAVVLRIDSPGGSATASETLWREVDLLRRAGKPVVVSMGAVAASGGYYVACAADVVVALPATLTGSIGVFGGKVVVRDLLARWGLTSDEVAGAPHALMFSARRGFAPDERRRLAAQLDAVYADFVAKVAAGRGRPVAQIEPVARGRVWTGADAHEHGLVDQLGGLRDAVRIARDRAGLPDDAPVRPTVPRGLRARLGRPRNSDDPRHAAAVSELLPLRALVGDLAGDAVDALLGRAGLTRDGTASRLRQPPLPGL